MTEDIVTWKGQLIDELSREELIDAVKYMGRRLAEYQTPYMSKAIAAGRTKLLFDDGITSSNYRRP